MEKSGQSSHTVAAVHSTPRRPCCVPPRPRKKRGRKRGLRSGYGRHAGRARGAARSHRNEEPSSAPGSGYLSLGPCVCVCVCVCKLSREAFKVILGPHRTHCTREHLNRRPFVAQQVNVAGRLEALGRCEDSPLWLEELGGPQRKANNIGVANTWYGVPTGSKSMQENLPYEVTRYIYALLRKDAVASTPTPHLCRARAEMAKNVRRDRGGIHVLERPRLTRYK